MTNECPVCGRYMVDPATPERCDRCEIARLREAIKLEAGVHARHFPVETTGEVKCYCDICLIAREG